MKNTDNFRYKGKPSRATAKSTLFAVSKDDWHTKENTGKSMKNALYVLRYAKRQVVFLLSQSSYGAYIHKCPNFKILTTTLTYNIVEE